ncbi:MAG: hypothetical protein K6B41_13595 [Butyrivibrio sp.]|nr:hypothetical protein [Butyrivibrio sp.]
MDLIAILGIIAAFLIIFIIMGYRNEKAAQQKYIRDCEKKYGGGPQIKYDNTYFDRINKYHLKHKTENSIDDITWSDLDMDNIFARINYCESSTGQEYMYHVLRSPSTKDDFDTLESHISFLHANKDYRLKMQLAFHKIGNSSRYSIYDYLDYLEGLKPQSNLPQYMALGLMAFALIETIINFSFGFLFLLIMIIYNVITYFQIKGKIDPYVTTFSYVMRVINSAEVITGLDNDEFKTEIGNLKEAVSKLQKFKKGSGILMSSSRMAGSGNPIDIIMDYIRILTHIDLIKFNKMFAEVNANKQSIDDIVTIMGQLETYVSITCFRASIEGNYCIPEFDNNGGFDSKDMYHLLIENPVSNSVSTKRGILLTGSNASGKSTFLKTVAITALLAQTVHTCTAKAYKAPLYSIYSSMALRDDLSGGDSYYIVETKSLKRIIDAAKESKTKILCFVDEVLRGTNTIERIAASTQILKYFDGINVQCFAATHDIELTTLLDDCYDIYHFEGLVENNDVHFDYKLHNGPAVNRNAIKLLGLLGYEQKIVNDAEAMAKNFEKNGIWTK